MAYLVFLAAGVMALVSMFSESDTALTVSLVLLAMGILLAAYRRWLRNRLLAMTPEQLAAVNPAAVRAKAMAFKIRKNVDEAERLLRIAIDGGDVEAMWDMGRLVEERDGLDASEQWFRMAAGRGHVIAQQMFQRGGIFNHDGQNPL